MIKVLMWGTGRIGGRALAELDKLSEYCVIGVYDLAKERIGQSLLGRIIYDARGIEGRNDYDLLLLCAQSWETMYLSAVRMGVEATKIFCWHDNKPLKIDEMYSITVNSQDGEELYLKNYYSDINQTSGLYVDVGAFHPTRFSNTFWAYQQGWRGINIEPNQENFRLFELMRPRDINVNVGISSNRDVLSYYQFEEASLNTFDRERAYKLSNDNGYEIKNISEIPVVPLQEVLDQYGIEHIDFLDVDVEAHEMDVLKSICFDKVDIGLILVEQLDMDLKSVLTSDIASLLNGYGYKPCNKYNRTVIYKKVK